MFSGVKLEAGYESIIENNEIKNAVWVSRDKCHVHRLFAGSNIYNTTEWRLKSSIVYTISGKGLSKHCCGKKAVGIIQLLLFS